MSHSPWHGGVRVTHGDVFLELRNGNQRTFNTLTGRAALRDDLVIY